MPWSVLLLALCFCAAGPGIAGTASEKGGDEAPGAWFSMPSFGQLGLLEIVGEIRDSRPAINQIRRFERNPLVKGIVLRIDSPGGEVGAVQEIFSELVNYRGHGKSYRPVVASFGGVSASGGYYLACAADRIYTNPGTLTGSIGVVIEFIEVEELMKKVGVRVVTIKSGRFKDTGNFSRSMDQEEMRVLQRTVNDVNEQFFEIVWDSRKAALKTAVAKSRKIKAAGVSDGEAQAFLRSVADGRVMSGRQAFNSGLADELGGLEDAIDAAAGMAGIRGRPSLVYEKRKTESGWFDFLGNVLHLPGLSSCAQPEGRIRLKYLLH